MPPRDAQRAGHVTRRERPCLGLLRLEPVNRDQALTLPEPVAARFVKVLFHGNEGAFRVCAHHVKIFAAPDLLTDDGASATLTDVAAAAKVPASPLVPTLLPAVSFAGVDPGIVYNNISPRLGFTYDLSGTGRTLVHANWALYYGQVGNGGVSSQLNPVTSVSVRYNWVDANHDGFVQPDEIYDACFIAGDGENGHR